MSLTAVKLKRREAGAEGSKARLAADQFHQCSWRTYWVLSFANSLSMSAFPPLAINRRARAVRGSVQSRASNRQSSTRAIMLERICSSTHYG